MRVIEFSDGFTSGSAPTQGSIQQNSLASYATDAAFVSAKGSAAAEGDAYYNTTYDLVRVYQNSAWRFLAGQVPSFATASAYVTAKGSAAENGDCFYDSTNHVLKVYQNGGWHYVRCGALPSYATDAAYVTAKGSAAANGDMFYDSTNHAIRCYQNGAWHFVKVAALLALASEAAFVTAKGSAAAAGDAFVDTGYNELKYYANSKWNTVPPFQPNLLINGGMDFWQRGTSFASAADGQYSADRFAYFKATTGAAHTLSRSTDIPTLTESGFQSSYSLLADCTTADAAVAAGDAVSLRYAMEGHEWAAIKNRTVTLSFWVKATKTGTYCVSFRNNGNDRSYVAEYTVSAADTWEKKTVTATMNPSGGTDDYTTGVGLRISWALMAGTTYQTTAGSWQTGNFLATANQVNACDDTANNFRIAQAKLEIGSNSSPFSLAGHTIAGELALAQRYYEKTYAIDTAPGTATSVGAISFKANGTGHILTHLYKVTKRTAPTVTPYNYVTGTSGQFRDVSAGSNVSWSAADISDNGCYLTGSIGGDLNQIAGHITVDAEL